MIRRRAVLAAAIAIVTFFVSAHALFELPSLPDTDSYYHLAVARLFADEGRLVDRLPWPRFSAMHEGFGDKEILFHVLLMPFTRGDATTGGRLAIALSNAAVAGVIAWLAIDALGPWGALLAPLLYLTAPYFWVRSIRLRPEFLSLILFLMIAAATVRRKLLLIALLSFALTLSHTAFHVLATMAVLWMLATRFFCHPERELGVTECAATFGGIGAGLLLHPHFPDNLHIWFLQNVKFLQMKSILDVGAEIQAPRLANLFLHNAGWWIAAIVAIALLVRSRQKPSRATVIFASMTAVFLVLQLMMERMSTYFFPIATLTLAYACAELVRRRILIAAVAIIAIAASAPFAMRTAQFLETRMPPDVERDYAAFAARVPANAKIAARWGATDAYVFFAPQGRYLNVLDPVFMAVPHPREYWTQRLMFDGADPDIAFAAHRVLDSDYIAYARWETPPTFSARVQNDPRFERIYDGYNVLLRVKPSDAFITDWPGYPRIAPGIEGFVDADRVNRGARCTTFSRTLSPGRYELAPWGPTRVWVDERLHAEVATAQLAIVGRGIATPGGNVRIETCRAGERSGFYLMRR
ncbi:MAG TPA: hypothetical protein VGQ76_26990 [Thermoanaerobaculia bacterium]|nr:hypothetical protein [Thermoanaerobaculia bacterium]